jgi:hypothetical protein
LQKILLMMFIVTLFACKKTPPIYLKCEYYFDNLDKSVSFQRDYVLNFDDKTVEHFGFSNVWVGNLIVENDKYLLHFPRKPDYTEAKIIIYKVSGISYMEYVMSSSNEITTGNCKKITSKDL